MSLEHASAALKAGQLADHDRIWFPKWLARFAAWNRCQPGTRLPVQQDLLIAFLRSIKSQGKPAWQRLQAVRALEFYTNHVLHQPAPWIAGIAARLAEVARSDRSRDTGHQNPEIEFSRPIDPQEPT